MSTLLLGFLIGIYHALEVDHLAAVAALVSRKTSIKKSIKSASVWGLGHAITLFMFGAAAIIINTTIPQQLARWLELAVGLMLILLGLDVIRKMLRDKVHYHSHEHENGQEHFHAHSHRGETGHVRHEHEHDDKFPLRSLFVGLMHGMAGSAALILLTLDKVENIWQGFLYMLLFGFGTILGMALISALIALPLRRSASGMTLLHNTSQGVIGIFSSLVGIYVVLDFLK